MTDYRAVKLMNNGVEYCFPQLWSCVDVLVVWWGWWGGKWGCSSSYNCWWGGGWWWVVIEKFNIEVWGVSNVIVGKGWCCGCNTSTSTQPWGNWGTSRFGDIIAYWGGGGNSCSWGNWWWPTWVQSNMICYWGCWCVWYGTSWGWTWCCAWGGWWGWSWWRASPYDTRLWWGASWKYSEITWERYWWGWAWGSTNCCPWCWWWWTPDWWDATACGWGGWWWKTPWSSGCNWGNGACWLVVVRYLTKWWVKNAYWGCKYVCGDYTYHCFTASEPFVVNPQWRNIKYLVVWGWGAGYNMNGWGWWDVCCGDMKVLTDSLSIVVWTCGTSTWNVNGGNSEIVWCANTLACWGCGATSTCGWMSGSWCTWWGCWWSGNYRAWGGWAWATQDGTTYVCPWRWNWGAWKYWYGGWWWGWSYCYGNYIWCACDWGKWWTNLSNKWWNATNCGWGWGWAWGKSANATCAWCGWCWVVDICYACNWSMGICSATWGDSCYICNGYCVHRFTQDWTFTIVS